MGQKVTVEVVGTAGCVKGVSAIWACTPTPELGNGVAVQAKGQGHAYLGQWQSNPLGRAGQF